MRHAIYLTLLAVPALPAPALANDSAAAIGIGGLELTRSDAITMDSEDLFLSQGEVRVRYRFTNRSDHDVETLVSFPVPDIPRELPDDLGDRSAPDYRDLAFRTTVNGAPVTLDYVERAEVAGRDVTARLIALDWPLRWTSLLVEQGESFLDRLTPAQVSAYLREGLLRRSAEDGTLVPAWNLITHVTRRQLFPAGKTVEVTHRYVPLVGGSVGGNLDPERRDSENFAAHRKDFCLDAAFVAGLDRRLGVKPAGERPFYIENWLRYILRSGANWRGPIGAFRLVVDKGKPGNLVSFCMDGVSKIAPTLFEVRKTNFEPKGDIDVLIVSWDLPE
jgi:hypothetical protein